MRTSRLSTCPGILVSQENIAAGLEMRLALRVATSPIGIVPGAATTRTGAFYGCSCDAARR
jgi:hypothetical protein